MMASAETLITLIIPTRERASKLKFTLETALSEDSKRLEVLVSDNVSQDDTKGVVHSFSDSRLRYISTGRRLSMRDNWEFAVNNARGHYIMIIGDDDGVMPGAIAVLEALIRNTPCPIYFWEPHIYLWPSGARHPQLLHKAPTSSDTHVSLGDLARYSFKWAGLRYLRLPLLYHSLVSRDILERIRTRTGRLFHSTQPDVFMAFALPVFSEYARRIGRSLTAYGVSYRSHEHGREMGDETLEGKVSKFLEEYGEYELHSTLNPGIPMKVNMIPDAILVAGDLFPDYYSGTTFNYNVMWAFMQSYWRFDSVVGIVKRRRAIRAYHAFSVKQFLIFSLIVRLAALRARAKRHIDRDSLRFVGDPPQNIRDFVQYMVTHEAQAAVL